MRLAHITLALMCVAAPAAADVRPSLPDWMAGCWETRDGDRWTDECWSPPRAGVMLGTGRSGTGDKLGDWEIMRIEADGGLVFYGAPTGTDWTPFPSAPDAEGGVTFLNTEHDYPQRIRYWREGERLNAEISMGNGSKAVRWSYQRIEQ